MVNDIKELIHKKQYHVLQVMNAETINLYWEIGEEIYRKQEENGWGKSIVQVVSFLDIKHRTTFRGDYLNPLLEEGKNAMTIPDKPQSKKQKFYSA